MRDFIFDRVDYAILTIFCNLDRIQFPLDPKMAISLYPNCRAMSYYDLAQISSTSLHDVIAACKSYTGCTQYDSSRDRYLILANQSSRFTSSYNRIRWTFAHEFGHVICGHFDEICDASNEKRLSSYFDRHELEEEADFFAASLLSPFPTFSLFKIHTIEDIERVYGLSRQAAEYRFSEYKRYLNGEKEKYHYHDSMKKILLMKCVYRPSMAKGYRQFSS